jgi:hypothetical protein
MVSFEKRTAIINLKQTQVMQVGIQSTKRKYVNIGKGMETPERDGGAVKVALFPKDNEEI